MSKTKNYFAALDSDSDNEVKVEKTVVQKKSVKKLVVKEVEKIDGKTVGFKYQPRVKKPSKRWSDKVRYSRPQFLPASREQIWSQLIDSATNTSLGGKKLSQKQRKLLSRKRNKVEEKVEVSAS